MMTRTTLNNERYFAIINEVSANLDPERWQARVDRHQQVKKLKRGGNRRDPQPTRRYEVEEVGSETESACA